MTWIRIGAVLGALAVAAGAFGAHGLRESLTPERLDVWKTAAHYHLVHSVALVAVGVLYESTELGRGALATSGWLFVGGVAVFAGSLYLLCLTDRGWLGAITPIGGLSLIAGWCALAYATFSA